MINLTNKTTLIDADSIIYKACFSTQSTYDWGEDDGKNIIADLDSAKKIVDTIIGDILTRTKPKEYYCFISGVENFRYDVDETYKSNRTAEKPILYQDIKDYIISGHEAIICNGYEADDLVVALKKRYKKLATLSAIDKDVLFQCDGRHYNFGKENFCSSTQRKALWYFYYQTLTGDTVDGYKGCKNIGAKKAEKFLAEANNPSLKEYNKELFNIVLTLYKQAEHEEEYMWKQMRLASMHQLDLISNSIKLISNEEDIFKCIKMK